MTEECAEGYASAMETISLASYFRLKRGNCAALAREIDISSASLWQMASGEKRPSPQTSMRIEQATKGIVSRMDLGPHDWFEIWVELAAANPGRAAMDRKLAEAAERGWRR